MLVGDPGAPIAALAPARDWYRGDRGGSMQIVGVGGPATREYAPGGFVEYYWTITFDGRYRFAVDAYASPPLWFRRSTSSVLVGLAFGSESGGRVLRLRRRPGPAPNLVLR